MSLPPVLVYRDTIVPRSEVAFMQRQYCGFTRSRPLWIGRRAGDAADPILFPLGPRPQGLFGGLFGGLLFKHAGMIANLEAFRALGAVAVHGQFGRGGALALPLAEQLGLPLVVTFHGGDAHKDSHWSRFALQRHRMRQLEAYASAFLCVSEGVRERLIARGVAPGKLQVLPIGVDIAPLPPRGSAGETILFVGRFVEMKGLDVLAATIRLLRERGVMVPVVLIGDGPGRAAVEASMAGMEGISFRGWQSQAQIRAAMAAARLVVIPSVVARSGEREGLPSVAVEAMSMGVPVVASSDAGTEGLMDGTNGVVVPTRHVGAFADAITGLFADSARALAIGLAGRRTIERDFDALAQSRKLESVLFAGDSHAF